MATQTTNYKLIKPAQEDFYDVDDFNANADIIDTQLQTLSNNKVDKVSGKGLSTNDYTTAEKNKLAGIATGANKYVHPSTHPSTMITGLGTAATKNTGTASGNIPILGVGGKLASEVLPETSSGKKYATLVVGTTASGHTAADVDYLCDGTADDVEITAAIQALPETGGKILIREGTYNLNAGMTIDKTDITVEGMGGSTVLKRVFDSGGGNKPNSMFLISGFNFSFYNLTIDGNYPNISNGATAIPCIYLNTTVEYFKADKITIVQSKGNCIEKVNGKSIILITECSFLNCQGGLNFDFFANPKSKSITITNNYFYNIYNTCILSEGLRTIISNNVVYNDFSANSDGFTLGENGVVTGNVLLYETLQTTGNSKYGISAGNNCIIANNSIVNYKTGVSLMGITKSMISNNNILANDQSINIDSYSSNNMVVGNLVWGKNITNKGTGNVVVNNKYN